jgi:hypothetical protein
MYGKRMKIMGFEIPYTLEHAIEGGEEGQHADNIRDRSTQYTNYVNQLTTLFNAFKYNSDYSEKFKFTTSTPDLIVLNYIATAGTNKKQNILLFKTAIEMKQGETSFTLKGEDLYYNSVKTLTNYFDSINQKYTVKSVTSEDKKSISTTIEFIKEKSND